MTMNRCDREKAIAAAKSARIENEWRAKQAEAARILSRRWAGVGRVADALLARRHLPAADVGALFRETDEEQAARERWQVLL